MRQSPDHRRRALVVGHPRSREALAAVRALGVAGWTVGIASAAAVTLARSSRWADRWHRVPPPHAGADAFVASVEEAITGGRYAVVFGAGDPEMLALSWGRPRLSAVVPYAAHDRVLRAADKWLLTQYAMAVGLAVPRTEVATDAAVAGWRGPAVVKPRLHWRPEPADDPAWLPATAANDAEQLARQVERVRRAGHEALLQESVAGSLTAMVTLRSRDGAVIARMQQRALRTYPPGAGISTRAVSVPVDPVLAARVDALLAAVEWFGLAQLQFLSPAPGEYRLIDFNGRFYGSLALAAGAGLNLPATWADTALGRPVRPLPAARIGVRYVWLGGDLHRAWCERRGGLAADLADTVRHAVGATHSIATLSDPMPAIALPLTALDGHRTRLVAGGRRRLDRVRSAGHRRRSRTSR